MTYSYDITKTINKFFKQVRHLKLYACDEGLEQAASLISKGGYTSQSR